MEIEHVAFGFALRRSNHWSSETPCLNHLIQLCDHLTADTIPVAWLSRCQRANPKAMDSIPILDKSHC